MPTNEAGLVAQIQKAIASTYQDCWIFKVVGSPYQESGVPDLLCCIRGLLVGLEVKFPRPGESRIHALSRATPGQRVQIMRINRAGGTADVVTSVQDALDLIWSGLNERTKNWESK